MDCLSWSRSLSIYEARLASAEDTLRIISNLKPGKEGQASWEEKEALNLSQEEKSR